MWIAIAVVAVVIIVADSVSSAIIGHNDYQEYLRRKAAGEFSQS